MDEERDVVVFENEEGDEFELEVLDYFFYNGQEYAVLIDVDEEECDCDHDGPCGEGECDHEHEQEIYIMKVLQLEDDQEEFVPVEDEALLDQLVEVVQTRFSEDDDELDDEIDAMEDLDEETEKE